MMKRVMMAVCLVGILISGCGKDKQEPSNSYVAPNPIVRESTTLYVPGDYATIQEAVNASMSGDFIRVSTGVFIEDVEVKGKDLSLRGAGIENTIVKGSIAIENSSEASVEGFSLQGGGIYVKKSMARISGNEILRSPGPGIQLENCPGSIISDNEIAYSLQEGILSNESDGVIGSNSVKHNGADGIVINNASPTLQINYVTDNQRDGISVRGFSHYAAPLLLQNRVRNNGGVSNYDIICFGDNTNPTGSGNLFGECLNCAECGALGGPTTHED